MKDFGFLFYESTVSHQRRRSSGGIVRMFEFLTTPKLGYGV